MSKEQLLAIAYIGDYERDKQISSVKQLPKKVVEVISEIGMNTKWKEWPTSTLRMVNALESLIQTIPSIREEFEQAFYQRDSLNRLNDSEFLCVDEISKDFSSKIKLQCRAHPTISNVCLIFTGKATQSKQLYQLPDTLKSTTFFTDSFYMDDGDMHILAKCQSEADQSESEMKYKQVPMISNTELPPESFQYV